MDGTGIELTFTDLMQLREESDDVLIGPSAYFPMGRVYGGLVVAQSLRAAWATVPSECRIHSLHAYFLLAGTHEEPIRYEVERSRDGRSFTTRRVVAYQSAGAILNLTASFQIDEPGAEVQIAVMPSGLPEPESLTRETWNAYIDNRVIPEPEGSRGHAASWIRVPDLPAQDPLLQSCALAYASDEMPMAAPMYAHPRKPDMLGNVSDGGSLMFASLDHAVWFHRPGRADRWMLHDVECLALGGGRGFALARVFDHDGSHVATVAQEVLLRDVDTRAPRETSR